MKKENTVVTIVGTVDFNQCDVTVDGSISLFVVMSDIPEVIKEEISKTVEEAIKYYSDEWDQKWEEAEIVDITLKITLSDCNKPKYSISTYFEDSDDSKLGECAYIEIDLSMHQEEMKTLIANVLINELM
ncbi:hypothetical protein [Clostridium sp. HBUAS56010]|uniref:hypothetical protein n=1 Tax=Clostridium sp. HBUAS56010 TaxID=2571127 RepID=UPI00117749FA|nr:hypothetical protein [Clostridium sp. HBUAS56010]